MNWDNFNRVAIRMIELAYINVLWIFFTLVGLGIFGIFPATTAMFGVIHKLRGSIVDMKIFPTFWLLFRQDFLKANGFGLIFLIIAYLVYFDFKFVQLNNGQFNFLLPVLAFVLLSFTATALLFFPVYAQFNLRFFSYFKQSFLIAVTSPFEVLAIALLLAIICFILGILPGAIPLFSGSVFAYFATLISYRAFRRIERKKQARL